jgi:hypothetical protein
VSICLLTLLDVRPLRRSGVRPPMLGRFGWILNEGAYAWVLADPRRLKPRPTVARLGLFAIPSEIVVPPSRGLRFWEERLLSRYSPARPLTNRAS